MGSNRDRVARLPPATAHARNTHVTGSAQRETLRDFGVCTGDAGIVSGMGISEISSDT